MILMIICHSDSNSLSFPSKHTKTRGGGWNSAAEENFAPCESMKRACERNIGGICRYPKK